MTEFYDITTDLKNALIASPFVNTVTTGGLEDVDLNKKTIFPLSHIIVNSAVPRSQTVSFNISIIAMDIVDESKDSTTNIFVGNDNEQDVLNTQFQVLNRLYQQMFHGQLFSDLIQIIGDPTCEPFTDRFENKLAGWTMTFDVEIPNEMTICGGSISPSCEDAIYQNSEGTFIESIPSGSTFTSEDIAVNLFDSSGNLLIDSVSTTNIDINITAPDAHLIIKKSGGTDITEIDLLSGSDTVQTISDSVITLKDSANATISTTNVQATDTANINAPDGVVTIKKSNGATIQTQSVKSNGTANSTVSDSVITLKDSSGTTISTTNVKATDAQNITAPDATIKINNRTFGTAKSNETKNFSLTTAKLMATGQTTSYATGDDGNLQQGRSFTTLLENNPFGNTNRFTALNGTQTYLNDIVLDWSTWDGQTVLGWYRIPLGTAITWANALSGANAFNIIGYSGWRLPNVNELMSIGIFSQIDMYNYAPFNILNKLIWTSTTALGNTLNAYRTPSTGFMTNGPKSATNSAQCYIPCRNFTNAELGI